MKDIEDLINKIDEISDAKIGKDKEVKPNKTISIVPLLLSVEIDLLDDNLKGGKRKLTKKYPVKTKRAIAQRRNKRSNRAR